MAYIGVNKAQQEAQKYQIESNFAQSIASTAANTALQVGQELVSQKRKNQLMDMKTEAYENINSAKLDIFETADPEEYEARIGELYDTYPDEYLLDKKVHKSVAEEFRAGIKADRAEAIVMAKAKMLDKLGSDRVTQGTRNLNDVLNGDVYEVLNKKGLVSKNPAMPEEEQEGLDFSDSFIGGSETSFTDNEVEQGSKVFSPELQAAYDSNKMSDFDLKIMAFEHIAKDMYPHDEYARKAVVEEYTERLKEEQPLQDLRTNFHSTFTRENAADWDYSKFRKEYAKGLEIEKLGGEPISPEQKSEIMTELHNMWIGLNTEYAADAEALYKNSISDLIFEAKMQSIENSNTPFLTSTVEEIYQNASVESGIPMRFLQGYKNSDYQIAVSSERIMNQDRLKKLLLTPKRSDSEEKEFESLRKLFTDGEYAELVSSASTAASTISNFAMQDASGIEYSTDTAQFSIILQSIEDAEIDSLQSFLDAVESGKNPEDGSKGLTDGQASVLAQKFQAKDAERKALEAERKEASSERIAELTVLGDKRTEAQNDELNKLSGDLTDVELATVQTRALAAAEALNDIVLNDALGKNIQSSSVEYTQIYNDILADKYKDNKTGFIDAMDGADNLTDKHKALLEGLHNSQENKHATIEAEAIENANRELAFMALTLELDNEAITAIADKYGITKEKNPTFFTDWENRNDSLGLEKASKAFNTLNYDDSITIEQVDQIAKDNNLTKEDAFYKQMKDIAEANWKKHLTKLALEGMGFAGEPLDGQASAVAKEIARFNDGEITKLEALNFLESKMGSLTEEEYKSAYNSIQTFDTINLQRDSLIFEENVYNQFLDEKDTIMPGTSRKRFDDAGLDYHQFADQLSAMEDTEAVNQHNVYASKYQEAQMYIALRDMGFDDKDISDMGLEVIDASFQNTIEWSKEYRGKKPLSSRELALLQIKEAKSKMLGDTLPSGDKFSGANSAKIDKAVKEASEQIQDNLLKSMHPGGKVNNIEVIAYLDTLKFTKDQTEYNHEALKFLNAGLITNDEYLDRTKDDVSKYKEEGWKGKSEAITQFQGYVKDQLGSLKDKKGKKITLSDYAMDSSIDNWTVAFTAAYDKAEREANGGPIYVDDIINKVYSKIIDTKYFDDANTFINMIKSDTTDFRSGLFDMNKSTSFKKYEEYMKGEMPYVNGEALARFLYDPNEEPSSYGETSGMLSIWDALKRNGVSKANVGRHVLADTARSLGLIEGLPDADDKSFDKDFKKFVDKLPIPARNQLYQTATVAKWSLDIMDMAKEELGDEIIRSLDINGDVSPIILGNRLGVQIGETQLMLDAYNQGRNKTFFYLDENNKAKYLTKTESATKFDTGTFDYAFNQSFVMDDWTRKSLIKDTGNRAETPVDYDELEAVFTTMVSKAQGSKLFNNAKTEYLSNMNIRVEEINRLTGKEEPYYKDIEIYIDKDAIDQASKDMAIITTPVQTFFKYRLIREEN